MTFGNAQGIQSFFDKCVEKHHIIRIQASLNILQRCRLV